MPSAQYMTVVQAPAKVATFLRRAHDRGLTVTLDGHTYTITSPNPIDDWELWLSYTPGRNGGSLTIRRYIPGHDTRKSTHGKVTRTEAHITIDGMGDGLDRHLARLQEKAQDATETLIADVEANVALDVPEDDENKCAQTFTHPAHHWNNRWDGSRLRTDLCPGHTAESNEDDADDEDDAELIDFTREVARDVLTTTPDPASALATLQANGRFALRTARTGRIAPNTPGKVRVALIRRGLVDVAGGILTDLGRAAHRVLVGA